MGEGVNEGLGVRAIGGLRHEQLARGADGDKGVAVLDSADADGARGGITRSRGDGDSRT